MMEYVPGDAAPTTAKILCCECGIPIEPNAANMCVACIRTKVDITEGIPRQSQLYWCKFCSRYLQPPNTWVLGELESKELLGICLKRVKPSLNKVRLIDAGFIWTEPHSKRLKIKITIQKEILGGAVLQQIIPIEFVVTNQMCDDCRRVEAKDFWRACVQVRQKCDHKKTLFYMEQLVLKHKAHIHTTGIKQMHGGVDFYYAKQQDARKLKEFLMACLPCRHGEAKELVTHDASNNVFDYKHTYSIEIVPICKDNVVCLPKKLAQSLGNMSQICICIRVSEDIHLMDPSTGQVAQVSSTVYWRDPFESLCQPRQLIEYTVIDIDTVDITNRSAGHGHISSKHQLGDAWVMKSSELGSTETDQICTRTHLAHLLNPGDTALGFDLKNCNANNYIFDKMNRDNLPDVILVKKVYDKNLRIKKRKWKLRRLVDENDLFETDSVINDFNEFLEDLEEDPGVRGNVNIYKNLPPVQSASASEMGDEELPQISLQEMLEDLVIEDEEMNQVE